MHSLDALRAGALLLGVVLHSLMPFAPDMTWMIMDEQNRAYAMPTITVIHLFRMTVFLILAGFFGRMVVRKRGMTRFLKERTIRIATPVIVMWPFAVLPLGLISGAWYEAHGLPSPAAEGTFDTGHLWFLWVLFECCLIFAAVREIGHRLAPELSESLSQKATAVVTAPWGVLVLAIPYFITQMWQGDTYAGITAPPTLVPEVSGLLAYMTGFLTGWFIARRPGAIEEIAVPWKIHLSVAVVTSFFVLLLGGMLWIDIPGGGWNIVLSAVSAVSAWSWTYGLFGACINLLSKEREWVRYLADSSYWIYIMHLTLVIGIGALLTNVSVPAEVKLLVTMVGATLVLTLTYDLFVRSTWLGKWLNGKKRDRVIFASRKKKQPELSRHA